MSQEAERFLAAEKIATELAERLNNLQKEMTSYHTATHELSEVKTKLDGFVDQAESIADDMREALIILKSIGGPELFERINRLNNELNNVAKVQATEHDKLAHNIQSHSTESTNMNKQLKKYILLGVGFSLLSLVISILTLILR